MGILILQLTEGRQAGVNVIAPGINGVAQDRLKGRLTLVAFHTETLTGESRIQPSDRTDITRRHGLDNVELAPVVVANLVNLLSVKHFGLGLEPSPSDPEPGQTVTLVVGDLKYPGTKLLVGCERGGPLG